MSYHFEELHPQQPPEDLQFHASTHTEIVRDAIDATHDAGSSVQLEDWVQCRRPRCLGLPVVRFVPSQDSVGTSLRCATISDNSVSPLFFSRHLLH